MENIYLEWQRLRRIEKRLEEIKGLVWLKDDWVAGPSRDVEKFCTLVLEMFSDVRVPFRKEGEG
jgi:hypothetical protein